MAKKSKAKKAIIGLLSVGVIAGGTAGAIYIVREYKVSNDAPVVDDVNSPNSNSNANDSDFNDNISNNIDNSTNNGSSEIDNNSDSNNNSGEIENNSGATEQLNPGEEIQAPVEKTDEEYKVEFENKIKELALNSLKEKYIWGTVSNINILKLNAESGKAYCTADWTIDNTTKFFFTADFGLTLKGTIKENYEKLNTLETSDIETTAFQSILKDAVEDAQFKSLCDYVLNQVGLDGAEVLNATRFKYTDGMMGTELTACYSNKIYKIEACTNSFGSQSEHINYMLKSKTNKISISNEEKFVDYDKFIETENSFYFTNQPMSFSERVDSLIDWEEDKIEITFFGKQGFRTRKGLSYYHIA